MKCELCGQRTAVVFVQQISGKSRTEVRLCAECAKERGLNRMEGDISQTLASLLSSLPTAKSPVPDSPPRAKNCPSCATSFEELKKRGQAACPACYEHFGAELFRKLYPETRSRRYSGRLPERLAACRSILLDLAQTRERLRAAVEAEDFETAALCRDRIRELEGEDGPRA